MAISHVICERVAMVLVVICVKAPRFSHYMWRIGAAMIFTRDMYKDPRLFSNLNMKKQLWCLQKVDLFMGIKRLNAPKRYDLAKCTGDHQ